MMDWGVFWSMIVFFFIFVPIAMLWGFALVDIFSRRGMSAWSRVGWLLLILFIPVLGALVYILVRPRGELTYAG